MSVLMKSINVHCPCQSFMFIYVVLWKKNFKTGSDSLPKSLNLFYSLIFLFWRRRAARLFILTPLMMFLVRSITSLADTVRISLTSFCKYVIFIVYVGKQWTWVVWAVQFMHCRKFLKLCWPANSTQLLPHLGQEEWCQGRYLQGKGKIVRK